MPSWKRPGLFIREYLGRVGQASPAEMHQEFKVSIKMENRLRPRELWLRPPTYHSFYGYFRRIADLGLVKVVGEDTVLEHPPGAPGNYMPNPPAMRWGIWSQAAYGRVAVREGAYRRLWALTPGGLQETEAWKDPNRALLLAGPMEKVPPLLAPPAPRLLPKPPAPPTPKPKPPAKKPRVKAEKRPPPPPAPAPPAVFTFPEEATRGAAQQLLSHFQSLRGLQAVAPEGSAEAQALSEQLEHLADDLDGWMDQVDELIVEEEDKEKPNEAKVERLQDQRASLEEAQGYLQAEDITGALEGIQVAFKLKGFK